MQLQRAKTCIRNDSNFGFKGKRSTNQGSVLVVAVVVCALVGMMLAAYMSMVSSQHSFTQHSQVWNNVIPMCESGIEEAMAHINHINTSSNFAINGWTRVGNVYRKTQYLNGGRCDMELDNGWPPIITVRGSLPQPLGIGDIRRAVRVRTKMNQRFPAVILARGTLTLGGSGRIDTFNSTNILESGPGGQYAASNATDRALVATTARTVPAIDVGSMTIYGSVATGPRGTVRLNNSGGVGSKPWVETPAYKGTIEPGHITDDANYYIPPPTFPNDFGPIQFVSGGVYPPGPGGTNYKYLLADGDYRAPTIDLSGSEKMLVTGNVRLHVTGMSSVSGNNAFVILGPDASIEWYASGPINLSGGACINLSGYAINFSLIALTPAPVIYSGNSRLIGTIYAPLSPVTVTGTADAVGAIVSNNFSLSGNMGIHFDEALKGNPKVRFLASSWTEINP